MYRATTAINPTRQDQILKSKKKPSTCPWCGSHRIAIVLAGMPVYIPEMESELDNGQEHISPQSGSDPSWQCTECGAQFYRETRITDAQ